MTGLDPGPSSLPSPESERPDSLLGVQGVPVSFKQRFGAAKRSPLLGVCKPRPGSYSLLGVLVPEQGTAPAREGTGLGDRRPLGSDFWSFPSRCVSGSAGFSR